ncbi:MAG: serpin family protein [Lachnospiraceae bacterium]|nr:serpin family protein [Lachnospiraceae bacterium]
MKKEELFETLSDIDEKKIKEAREYKKSGGARIYRWITATVAVAAIAITAIFSPIFKSGDMTVPGYPKDVKTILASYPAPTAANLSAEEFVEGEAHWKWWDEFCAKADKTRDISGEMLDYYNNLSQQLLINGDENTVISPLNTYIAFAMLAETAEGNTRQQILDMLGASDIGSLRNNVKHLWESNYADTPTVKSLLANSLWLDSSRDFNEKTLKLLADNYYASSFRGTPGSEAFSEALRKWTDDNTGNLLTDYTKDLKMNTNTVLAIMSTIYFKACWENKFYEEVNTSETFHGTKGDTTVEMMHQSDLTRYCITDKFTVVKLDLADSGYMFFYLPKEGVNVNELASDPEALSLAQNPYDSRWDGIYVNMSIPKFKVTAQSDLIETLRALGVTDALDYAVADFSPITEGKNELFLSSAEHAALVEIDEDGVTGAAYTALMITEGAYLATQELDFVLDEPFMFVVTGYDGSVLFDGLVKNIE